MSNEKREVRSEAGPGELPSSSAVLSPTPAVPAAVGATVGAAVGAAVGVAAVDEQALTTSTAAARIPAMRNRDEITVLLLSSGASYAASVRPSARTRALKGQRSLHREPVQGGSCIGGCVKVAVSKAIAL